MALNRPHRERERAGDLRIGGSLRRQYCDFALTAAERFDLIRPGLRAVSSPLRRGRRSRVTVLAALVDRACSPSRLYAADAAAQSSDAMSEWLMSANEEAATFEVRPTF